MGTVSFLRTQIKLRGWFKDIKFSIPENFFLLSSSSQKNNSCHLSIGNPNDRVMILSRKKILGFSQRADILHIPL